MSSYQSHSMEFNDISIIAGDLTKSLPQLSENAIAFCFCDSQLDSKALLSELNSTLNIPIYGGTSFSNPYPDASQESLSAELTVLDRTGISFAAAVSDSLNIETLKKQTSDLYDACIADLKDEPKMLMVLLPMMATSDVDLLLHTLFTRAGSVPVFGGVTTNDLDHTAAYAYCGSSCYTDRLVLLAFGGDINPVFSVGSQLTTLNDYGPAVTECEERTVYKVDDMTFGEYMRTLGIEPEKRQKGIDAMVQYGPLPCRLKYKLEDDDGVPEIRCISYTELENESATFSSRLPLGTQVYMGIIQISDVSESTADSARALAEKIAQNESQGYHYSMVFSVPCVARYYALLGNPNTAYQTVREYICDRLPISSYYGFCEVGPTEGKTGELHNRSHNASVVMCAI